METREEKLATWAEPSITGKKTVRILEGSIPLNPDDADKRLRISDQRIKVDQLEDSLLSTDSQKSSDLWHFKALSFPRIKAGRLVLSFPRPTFDHIQDLWNLHPRTIEIFLSNNGVFTTFNSSNGERSYFLLKVANSRSTGFDCVSVTWDRTQRTTYALYHHLEDEASVFANMLSTPTQCIDPHFFIAALYRSHHGHIETHRNTIDDAIQGIERQTGFGNPGRLMRRTSLDEYPVRVNSRSTIQQLSYFQTDLAIIGHVARCSLDCGEWLIQLIDESLQDEQSMHVGYSGSQPHQLDQQHLQNFRAIRLMIRQDVEYIRRRTVMLLSQVHQMKDRAQSQTNFMLSTITQSDAEYSAAIAVEGKRDSIAMRTIAILGIVFLPGTFTATLLGMDMFKWIDPDTSLTVSPRMWIYWAVTVPLTLVTFLIWALWSRREYNKSNERLMSYRTQESFEADVARLTESTRPVTGEKMA